MDYARSTRAGFFLPCFSERPSNRPRAAISKKTWPSAMNRLFWNR